MKRLRNNRSEMTPPHSTIQFTPQHTRRILCLSPEYAWSFATFNYAFPLMGSVKAFMPPQGILLIAALAPARWEIRFIDENIRPARKKDVRAIQMLTRRAVEADELLRRSNAVIEKSLGDYFIFEIDGPYARAMGCTGYELCPQARAAVRT